MDTTKNPIRDNLHIVWTIASKDIVDSIKNKLVISLVLGMSLMLSMPRILPMILVRPRTRVLVHDPGNTRLVAELENSSKFDVQRSNSITDLKQTIGGSGFGLGVELGIDVPVDLDQILETDGEVGLDGYVAWPNRTKAMELKSDFEERFTEVLGQPVRINIEGNLVYPPPNSGLLLGLLTITLITNFMMMGISLVPNLLFEEKQTKTIEALLVSPASSGHVAIGKALTGLFYMLVIAVVILAIFWEGVVHWEVAILFVIGTGLFSVALGLVLGSFFERQPEVSGWTMVLMVLIIGSLLADMMDLKLPDLVTAILPLLPSVALADIFQFSFLEHVPWAQVWSNLGSVLVISALFYTAVVWKIRRSDR